MTCTSTRKALPSIPAAVLGGLMAIASTLAGSAPGSDRFESGLELYRGDDFEASIKAFEEAVEQAPRVAKYHHWLGKAYGRLAQRSNWLQAPVLARKAKGAFEKAVELDPRDAAALRDLMSYYEEAPGVLGGDKSKAKAIRNRLSTLDRDAGD
jgi:tetratricopeptide (TPR) repeat protein